MTTEADRLEWTEEAFDRRYPELFNKLEAPAMNDLRRLLEDWDRESKARRSEPHQDSGSDAP